MKVLAGRSRTVLRVSVTLFVAVGLGAVACTTQNPNFLGDASVGPDLAGADLAGLDLTGVDQAGLDLAGGDMAAPPGSLVIEDVAVHEGNLGSVTATFHVHLTAALPFQVTVDFHTMDVTAVAGLDYEAANGTLVFAPGETTHSFDVLVDGDTIHEQDETFHAILADASGAPIAVDTGTCTILDDDSRPVLSVDDAEIGEGDDGVTTMTFTASLDGESGVPVVFSYATSDGTATIADGDYFAVQGRLTIDPGRTQATIQIPIQADLHDEADEHLSLVLTVVSGATLGDGTGDGQIDDDDDAPTISIDDGAAYEGATASAMTVPFVVRLSAPSGRAVTVSYVTANGTAIATADYTPTAGTLLFAAGETSKRIDVPVLADSLSEGEETFSLELLGPTFASLANNSATGTIYDDDQLGPVLSTAGQQLTESGVDQTMTFTVSIPSIQLAAVSFHATTLDVLAEAGTDYDGIDQDYSIPIGSKSVEVKVTIHGDDSFEADETFLLRLSSPSTGTLSTPMVTGRILNDDAMPSLTLSPVDQVEGNHDAVLITIPIDVSTPSGLPGQLAFATQDQSAHAPGDYATTFGLVRLPIGASSWQLAVPINGDTVPEMDETFLVSASSPLLVSLATSSVVCTIDNDD